MSVAINKELTPAADLIFMMSAIWNMYAAAVNMMGRAKPTAIGNAVPSVATKR